MAASAQIHLLLLLFFSFLSAFRFATASSLCPLQSIFFITDIHSQCPLLSISPSTPIQVDGESLDKVLSSKQGNTYSVVLFYASWCPFSRGTLSTFDVLSSMFPQMTHLVVEESSVLPIVFSRYGVHSLPAILIANGTTKVRYHGSKDLSSLVHFYKRITACSSAYLNLNQGDFIVPNASYALTAYDCVQCTCGPKDLILRCFPSPFATNCNRFKCRGTNLYIGEVYEERTMSGCDVTKCFYRGYHGHNILSSLSYSTEFRCSGNRNRSTLQSTALPEDTVLRTGSKTSVGEASRYASSLGFLMIVGQVFLASINLCI